VLRKSIILATIVSLFACWAEAQRSGSVLDVDGVVARMMAVRQENQARMRAYVVKRDYQLLDKAEQTKAQLIASIAYHPPDQKEYNIERSSGGIGGKVLRDILEKEAESTQQESRRQISPQNYEFRLLGRETVDGRDCYVLSLVPRRDEKDLIRGKLWVDASDFRIHRLEGTPVKSPSWWIRDIHILMIFARVDGMWLHTFTQAVATVRFKGTYIMQSRDLEYSSTAPKLAGRAGNTRILAGAAMNP